MPAFEGKADYRAELPLLSRSRHHVASRHLIRGLLIYCADYRCSHSIAISGDAWPELSDIEARFVCRACGKPLFGFAPASYHP